MNSKFERQLWMLLIFMVLLLVFLMAFLLMFAGEDVAWAVGSVWEMVSPFLPFVTGALGFWLGFRSASGQVGKVLNTVGMAIPGMVANAKLQTEMTKLERSRTIDQHPLPPGGYRAPQVQQPPAPIVPYQDVIDGYRGALRNRTFDYLEESDYESGNQGF